jgi:colanic acid/amylovoran biosynthesis protein
MRKKVMVNAYFAKNLGDDLFLKVLFDRYPSVEWYLLTANKEYYKIFNNYKNVSIINSLSVKIGHRTIDVFSKINKLLKYKQFDAYLTIGGSIFMERENWDTDLLQRNYLPKLFFNNKKKSFIIGANFGPYSDENFIGSHKEFFQYFDDVCFRDNYSYSLFKDKANIRYAPDVVFNLQYKISMKREKRVGFSIIELEKRKSLAKYSNNYYEKISELIKEFINNGYEVSLFSFCEKEGDLRVAEYIKNNCDIEIRKKITIVNYEDNIDNFLEKFNRCEIIVGTRFHSIILAILFNQSFIPIVYSKKTSYVLSDLGMDKKVIFIENINQIQTTKLVNKAGENRYDSSEVKARAKKQFDKLDKFIFN